MPRFFTDYGTVTVGAIAAQHVAMSNNGQAIIPFVGAIAVGSLSGRILKSVPQANAGGRLAVVVYTGAPSASDGVETYHRINGLPTFDPNIYNVVVAHRMGLDVTGGLWIKLQRNINQPTAVLSLSATGEQLAGVAWDPTQVVHLVVKSQGDAIKVRVWQGSVTSEPGSWTWELTHAVPTFGTNVGAGFNAGDNAYVALEALGIGTGGSPAPRVAILPPTTPLPAALGRQVETPVLLQWSAAVPQGVLTVTYTGEYTADGGDTWHPLFSAQSGRSYSWNALALRGQRVRYRVRATDSEGEVSAWGTSDTFSVGLWITSPAIAPITWSPSDL